MILRFALTAAALPLAVALVASAPADARLVASPLVQSTEVVAPPSPDADALAAQMRILAENPEDLTALITAGDLATRLGDTAAADALFLRADRIAPDDRRLLAAKGALAVHEEHPGQALRLFSRAEAAGQAIAPYLADRGLAYDLTGDQARAQRDYREALKRAPSDEVTRRLALSLGIAGRRDAALDLLDPLVRRSDRGGWRVRAFVLAMTGDVDAAQQIATSMLPPNMATGLEHFFRVLPTLDPIDKAFAVHFGELRGTSARLADARLAPVLPALAVEPEPVKPVALAQATPPKPTPQPRGRRKRQPEVAAPAPAPVIVAAKPLPAPPREQIDAEPALATPPAQIASAPPPSSRPVQPKPEQPKHELAKAEPAKPPVPKPDIASAQPRPVTSEPVRGAPERPTEIATVSAPRVTPPERPVRSETNLLETIVSGLDSPATRAEAPKPAPAKPVATKPVVAAADCLPAPKGRATTRTPVRRGAHAAKPATVCGDEDKALADAKSAKGKASDDAADCLPAPRGRKGAVATRKGRHSAKPATVCGDEDKALADAKAAKGKASDDAADCLPGSKTRKGAKSPARKGARGKSDRCDTDKPDARGKGGKSAEPARIWVQVAGGAYEGDLAKAWAAVRAKAPAAFKGRQGWTTPLRATNRVLTGPFKTGAEAQAFVNMVAKDGISAFVINSEAGQKVDRLGAQ